MIATVPSRALTAAKATERWRGPESNRRHHGFQPCALPTELPRQGGGSLAAATRRSREEELEKGTSGPVIPRRERPCGAAA